MSKPSMEQEILMVMRKVLSAIIKDTATPPGMQHPLRQQTMEDMRACLVLIATRERELAQAQGIQMERPFFTDAKPAAEVVSIDKIQHPKQSTED